jgi:hypothetical protein
LRKKQHEETQGEAVDKNKKSKKRDSKVCQRERERERERERDGVVVFLFFHTRGETDRHRRET